MANWNTDGQQVRVLRGTKTLENFPGVASARSTQGTYFDNTGTLQIAPPATVRQDWSTRSPVILNEPAATNFVRNPLGVGGTVGTIGSGGIMPTFASMNTVAGLSRAFLGNFVVNGITVQRYRYFGTVSTAQAHGISPDRSGQFVFALPVSQQLEYSFWIRLQAGSFTGIPIWTPWWDARDSTNAGVGVGAQPNIIGSITGTLQKFTYTLTTPSSGSTPFGFFGLGFTGTTTLSAVVDCTVDIGGVQLELGNIATSLILPPAGTAVSSSRGADLNYTARNILIDPPYASLVQVFAGVMGQWRLDETSVEIDLRDASYYLERAMPRNLYGGTGLLDGDSGLVGLQKPIAIGQNAAANMQNVTPVLIDASALIYQVHDGSASIFAVYDGGYAGNAFSADVASLYAGSTTAGHYRTCVAKGLFQLGSVPMFQVTADICENFGSGDQMSLLALRLLLTNMSVPNAMVGSVDGLHLDGLGADPVFLARALAMEVALYIATDDSPDGVTLLSRLLEPTGACLVPCRDGKLRAFVPSAIPGGATPALTFNSTNILTIEPGNLPDTVDPPPWRVRIACDRNWTVMTTGIAGAVPTARRTWLAAPYRTGTAQDTPTALTQMTRPNDQPVIATDSGAFGTCLERGGGGDRCWYHGVVGREAEALHDHRACHGRRGSGLGIDR